MVRQTIHLTYRTARKVVIAVVGVTVLTIGVAMIVLPGPAFLVIPAGLAILGAEFAWARHWLGVAREGGRQVVSYVRSGRRVV